jgi:hypothetical protein
MERMKDENDEKKMWIFLRHYSIMTFTQIYTLYKTTTLAFSIIIWSKKSFVIEILY